MNGGDKSAAAADTVPPDAPRFDAFISYSHAADGELAPALQKGLQTLGKPWHRRRVLHVFRDQTSLNASPGLWPDIERALGSSRFFILLASPEAAESVWVRKEVAWWLERQPSERLLIAVTDGSLAWDTASGEFDRHRSNAVPEVLLGCFAEEPLWVDLRWARAQLQVSTRNPQFRDCTADLAAPLHGCPKDDLIGEDIRNHRRAIRLARSAGATVVLLAAAAIIAAIVAIGQRNAARHETLVATSRQLAALSESELSSNLDVALLLAVEAYRTDPNPQTRAALLQANLYSPRLERFLPMGAQVTALAASRAGSTIVAGLANGRVVRQESRVTGPTAIGSLGAAVTSVAVSSDGRVVAAANASRTVVWRAGGGVSLLPCGLGQLSRGVGMSPSGHTVAVACQVGDAGPISIRIVNEASGRIAASHSITEKYFYPSVLALPSDKELVMFGGLGDFQVRRIPAWSLKVRSTLQFGGVHGGLTGYSGDGRFQGFVISVKSGPNNDIPVRPTSKPASSQAPLTGLAPISGPSALTITADGRELAVADSGTIYVARVAAPKAPHEATTELMGGGSINPDALRFVGDGSHVLSASADMLALWNLTQYDRLSRAETTSLTDPCDACGPPLAAVSPDRRAIAIEGSSHDVVLQSLAGRVPPKLLTVGALAPPLWDGKTLVLFGGDPRQAHRLPAGVRLLQPANANDPVIADAVTSGGRTVTEVDDRGDIYVQDSVTGRVEHHIAGPPDLTGSIARLLQPGQAAIDSATGVVATVDNKPCGRQGCPSVAQITDLASGTVTRLPGVDAVSVAFAGSRLLVQRLNGHLEVWNARGSMRLRVLAGDPSYAISYPVADGSGDLVARQQTNGTISLTDLNSGTTLATLPAPASGSLGLLLGLAFSPDGTDFVTVVQTRAGTTPEIIQHDISGPALVRSACATAGRRMAPIEWRTFVGTTPPDNLECK